MSFRSLHFSTAAKQIKATASIVELAAIEAEELAGGEHRPSLVEEFADRARLLAVTATEDERLEAQLTLEGKAGSIILAALEGDSHGDDIKGPEETRDGGESPSAAAVSDKPTNVGKSTNRIVGRMARVRGGDGKPTVTCLSTFRGRSG